MMLGLGSEIQVSEHDLRERVEHLSVGDFVYDHLSESMVEIQDMFVRTINLDKHKGNYDDPFVFESRMNGQKIANRWNIIFPDFALAGLPELNPRLENAMLQPGDLAEYFEVFNAPFLARYKLIFDKPVLLGVGGMLCHVEHAPATNMRGQKCKLWSLTECFQSY